MLFEHITMGFMYNYVTNLRNSGRAWRMGRAWWMGRAGSRTGRRSAGRI